MALRDPLRQHDAARVGRAADEVGAKRIGNLHANTGERAVVGAPHRHPNRGLRRQGHVGRVGVAVNRRLDIDGVPELERLDRMQRAHAIGLAQQEIAELEVARGIGRRTRDDARAHVEPHWRRRGHCATGVGDLSHDARQTRQRHRHRQDRAMRRERIGHRNRRIGIQRMNRPHDKRPRGEVGDAHAPVGVGRGGIPVNPVDADPNLHARSRRAVGEVHLDAERTDPDQRQILRHHDVRHDGHRYRGDNSCRRLGDFDLVDALWNIRQRVPTRRVRVGVAPERLVAITEVHVRAHSRRAGACADDAGHSAGGRKHDVGGHCLTCRRREADGCLQPGAPRRFRGIRRERLGAARYAREPEASVLAQVDVAHLDEAGPRQLDYTRRGHAPARPSHVAGDDAGVAEHHVGGAGGLPRQERARRDRRHDACSVVAGIHREPIGRDRHLPVRAIQARGKREATIGVRAENVAAVEQRVVAPQVDHARWRGRRAVVFEQPPRDGAGDWRQRRHSACAVWRDREVPDGRDLIWRESRQRLGRQPVETLCRGERAGPSRVLRDKVQVRHRSARRHDHLTPLVDQVASLVAVVRTIGNAPEFRRRDVLGRAGAIIRKGQRWEIESDRRIHVGVIDRHPPIGGGRIGGAHRGIAARRGDHRRRG